VYVENFSDIKTKSLGGPKAALARGAKLYAFLKDDHLYVFQTEGLIGRVRGLARAGKVEKRLVGHGRTSGLLCRLDDLEPFAEYVFRGLPYQGAWRQDEASAAIEEVFGS
jgi:hypothetical protein